MWHISIDAKTIGEGLGGYPRIDGWPTTKYYAVSSENGVRGLSGNPQRNYAIDRINDGYVYFLDDDTIMHPCLLNTLSEYMDGKTGFIVNQVHKNEFLRLLAHPQNMKVTHVDTAQVLFPRYFIGDVRWETHNYCADGVFIETIYDNCIDNGEKFMFINRPLSYYNYLRGEE